jgi:cytochrome P450
MANCRILAETYDTLYYPAPYFTAPAAYKAREFLLSRLRTFHEDHRTTFSKPAVHRLNAVAVSDPNWEDNPDYYMVELLMSLAVFPTLSTLTVWLLRHLLVDTPLLKIVVDEIQKLRGACHGQDEPPNTVDLSSLRTTCPWLVASWHEALRLHMTVVPRSVQKDFDLVVPSTGKTVSLNTGDILLVPMCTANMDPQIWGSDFKVFNPARFITPLGKLSIPLTRKVRGFGIAGNLCPGRHYAFTTAMSVLVAVFLSVDIRGKDNKGFRAPKSAGGFSGGFERHGNDDRAVVSRRRENFMGMLNLKV